MVALTGSKFAGGPTFCGVLLVPGTLVDRYRERRLHPALGAYSCAADWPATWHCGQSLPTSTNFGLLLRWQAALESLHQFHRLPAAQVSALLATFSRAVQSRIAADGWLKSLPVASLHRADGGWDHWQTVFPFLLRHADGSYFTALQTRALHQALMHGERRYQLGQPVACGLRDGIPVMALRLCASATMVIAGAAGASMTDDALAALDHIAVHLRTGSAR